mmetsp:Transcript_9544/g.58157  ORF Transcript_9544/g.58157 Transcript_9544/m.58157 type:complete len:85 (-) Transcript_9544:47-301(-)
MMDAESGTLQARSKSSKNVLNLKTVPIGNLSDSDLPLVQILSNLLERQFCNASGGTSILFDTKHGSPCQTSASRSTIIPLAAVI